jgi:predicted HTH domain antitoxin
MRNISLTIPDALDLNDRDIAMLLASTLFEKGKLTLGQAAQLANLSKRTFAELLGKYDVSIFNDGANNLLRDVQNS